MKIVAISNQKGGVGKTTTAVNLSAALAEWGLPVLLIDLDAQANATSGLGQRAVPGGSIYPVLVGEKTIDEQIIPTAFPHLSLLPAEVDLAGVEIEIARLDQHLIRLRQVLAEYRTRTAPAVVFLDCPPSLGILMTNALAAADSILTPVQCEYYALEGYSNLRRLIEMIRSASGNHTLQLEGVVMTMYDSRTSLSKQVLDDVRTNSGSEVYRTIIPRTVRFSEASSHGKPITVHDPSSVGAQAYRELAAEFIERNPSLRSLIQPPAPRS